MAVPNGWHAEKGILVHQRAPHFVAGRDRIKSRPLSLYKELLLYATGQKWYPGAERWVDEKGNSHSPGHKFAAYFMEASWGALLCRRRERDPKLPGYWLEEGLFHCDSEARRYDGCKKGRRCIGQKNSEYVHNAT